MPPIAAGAGTLLRYRNTRFTASTLVNASSRSLPPVPPLSGARLQATAGPGTATNIPPVAGGPDLRYLLHHSTMGFTVPDYLEARQLGWATWLEQQLQPETIDDSDVDSVLVQLPTLTLSASELLIQYPDDLVEQVLLELQFAVMLRMIYSRKLLFERVVELWTDHFNISQLDDLCLWFKTVDDREVVRANALGKFPEMLSASAKSPAMLWYLDNYTNIVGAPQENYARELMELHTLGVDGPYSEQDVREVARCFTGWTLDGVYTSGGSPGEFIFVPQLHDTGSKQVLGITIPPGGGIEDGEMVLQILATHPKTAEFVATKLCRGLLGYEPSTELVGDVAAVYLATDGDIKEMVRHILHPETVAAIPLDERTKLRRPAHFVVSLLRAGLVGSTDLLSVTARTLRLGQVPYFHPTPDGYPDSLDAWGSGVLPRWEYASDLFGGAIPGNVPDSATLQALIASSPKSGVLAGINWTLTGGLLPSRELHDVQLYLDSQPVLTDAVLREAFGLAASSPGYQFF